MISDTYNKIMAGTTNHNPASTRMVFFDNLRVLMMVVVIGHHVGQAYGPIGGWWPVQEPNQAAILDPFFMVNRSFGMSLFFMIAGFFTARSYERGGLMALVRSRLRRLGFPLLVFSLARSDEALPPCPEVENTAAGSRMENTGEQKRMPGEPDLIDLSIEITWDSGQSVCTPLSYLRPIPPALHTRYTKLSRDTRYYGSSYEPVLQTFEVELASLSNSSCSDMNKIKTVCFIFDQCAEGFIILD